MGEPALSSFVDHVASNVTLNNILNDDALGATKVSPLHPVDDKSGKIMRFSQDDLLRVEVQPIKGSQEHPVGGQALDTVSYDCEKFGIARDFDAELKARYNNSPARWRENGRRYLEAQLKLKLEMQTAATLFSSAFSSTAAGDAWSDKVNATPLDDVAARIEAIRTATGGYKPNVGAIAADAFDAARRHPQLVELYKHTQGGILSEQILAELFGLDRLVVFGASRNTANKGATASYSDIASGQMVLLYVDDTEGEDIPTAMRSVTYRGFEGMDYGMQIREIDMPWRNETTRLAGDLYLDVVVTSAALGARLTGLA